MNAKFYEQRLEADLCEIRAEVAKVGESVRSNVARAVKALLDGDSPAAYEAILGDHAINRRVRLIDGLCHRFVARHLPSAGHLRFISSVLRLNIALERVGDYAVTIGRKTVQLESPLPAIVRTQVERMAADSGKMLQQAVLAFVEEYPQLARETLGLADVVERTLSEVIGVLVRPDESENRSIGDLFGMMTVFNCLERVSDQAKNICEETLFASLGEIKAPKMFRVLFLDADHHGLAWMAVALARKAFPKSGTYGHACLLDSEADPQLVEFLNEFGHDTPQDAPRYATKMTSEWKTFHLLVSLDGPITRYVTPVPFYSVALEWELPKPLPLSAPEGERRERFLEIYRALLTHIRDLMVTLRGEEAL